MTEEITNCEILKLTKIKIVKTTKKMSAILSKMTKNPTKTTAKITKIRSEEIVKTLI